MRKIFLGVMLVFLVFGKTSAYAAAGPRFFWSNPSGTAVGTNNTVTLSVDTAGAQTTGADVVIKYDPTSIEIVNIAFSGNPYAQSFQNINAGRIHLSSTFTDAVSGFSGSGNYATFTYNLKRSGATAFDFDCTRGSTSDTNILEKNTGNDIVDCGALSSITIAATTTPVTVTPTPTVATIAPTTSPTWTPSPKPMAALVTKIKTTFPVPVLNETEKLPSQMPDETPALVPTAMPLESLIKPRPMPVQTPKQTSYLPFIILGSILVLIVALVSFVVLRRRTRS